MTDPPTPEGVRPLPPGDPLYGSPTAPELLHAVGHFLRHQVPELLPPLEAFHARVAANVVAMVARQLEAGDAPRSEAAALLAQAGAADEDALARAVRAGDFDDRTAQLRQVLTVSVRARLAVANPAYLAANPAHPEAGRPPS